MTAYDALAAHIAQYNDLLNILNTLKWDMRTKMPAGGSRTRGAQLETLTKLAKDMFVSERTARLLDAAENESASLNWTPIRRAPCNRRANITRSKSASLPNWSGA